MKGYHETTGNRLKLTTLTVTWYSSEDQQCLPHHGCQWRHWVAL